MWLWVKTLYLVNINIGGGCSSTPKWSHGLCRSAPWPYLSVCFSPWHMLFQIYFLLSNSGEGAIKVGHCSADRYGGLRERAFGLQSHGRGLCGDPEKSRGVLLPWFYRGGGWGLQEERKWSFLAYCLYFLRGGAQNMQLGSSSCFEGALSTANMAGPFKKKLIFQVPFHRCYVCGGSAVSKLVH